MMVQLFGGGGTASAARLAETTQMEHDKVPHLPRLHPDNAQHAVQPNKGGVVVSSGDVYVRSLERSQSIPKGQYGQGDATQTDQHEQEIPQLETLSGDEELFGEMGHSACVEDGLGHVVQKQDGQRHAVEVECVSSSDKGQIDNRVDAASLEFLSLHLLQKEFWELVKPIADLKKEEQLGVSVHVSVLVRIADPQLRDITSQNSGPLEKEPGVTSANRR